MPDRCKGFAWWPTYESYDYSSAKEGHPQGNGVFIKQITKLGIIDNVNGQKADIELAIY